MIDVKKLVKSYKRAVDVVCANKCIQLEEDKEITFQWQGKEVSQIYKKGFVVPDVSEKMLADWIKINYIVNQVFQEQQDELNKLLEEVDL